MATRMHVMVSTNKMWGHSRTHGDIREQTLLHPCFDSADVVERARVRRMSDLAAPFLAVFAPGDDALAFWAFERLMRRAARNFRCDEQGIQCVPPDTAVLAGAGHPGV